MQGETRGCLVRFRPGTARARPALGRALAFGLAAGAVLLAPALAQGAGGSLDKSFGKRGKVLTRAGERAYSVAIAPRGRIVAAGGTRGGHSALARFKPNGHLDHSFSGDGKLQTPFGGHFTWASSVAIGPRHRIVAAGGTNKVGIHHPTRFALARYRSNGKLDRSFSGDGKATANLGRGAGMEIANAAAIDSHGRVVVAGEAPGKNGSSQFALARFKANGHLDRSFGNRGKVKRQVAHGVGASSVVIAARGRIVVGGGGVLARFKPNGQLDRSFGAGGKAPVSFDVNSVALDSRSRIVAAGGQATGARTGDLEFALARFSPSGAPDPSFGRGGKMTTDFNGTFDAARSVAIDSRGRITAFGYVVLAGKGGRFALARYLPNGPADRTFGRTGKVTTNFKGSRVRAGGVAIDSQDRIVAAGEAKHRFALARYTG